MRLFSRELTTQVWSSSKRCAPRKSSRSSKMFHRSPTAQAFARRGIPSSNSTYGPSSTPCDFQIESDPVGVSWIMQAVSNTGMSEAEHLPGHRGFFDEPFPPWMVIAPPFRDRRQSTQPQLPLRELRIRVAGHCGHGSDDLFIERSVEWILARLVDRYGLRIVDVGRVGSVLGNRHIGALTSNPVIPLGF